MPQMSPLLWMLLFFYTLLILFFVMIIFFFFSFNKFKDEVEDLSSIKIRFKWLW